MSKREAFFESVCKENVDVFLKFTKLHNDATEPFDLDEVVQEVSKKQREALWDRLATLLRGTMADFPPDRWNAEDRDDAMEVEVPPDLEHTMEVLGGVTQVVMASVAVIQDGDAYNSLLQCATILNGLLASLPASEVPLQQAVFRVCEAWWKKGLLGKEELGRTAFLMCLEKSFMLKKPGAEIQRMWGLHEVLLSVDFQSEDSEEMMDLLLRCFLSGNHIKHDDGKRLMVFLFGRNVSFIRMIHGTIKNQLQFFTKTLTDHIAEIYFRAWKKASGEALEEMETACIQDFMQHAILLHRNTPVHPRVRQILSYFHKRKGHHNLDEMLHRLYKPILWRALTAANSEVRANATLLFTEAFPVHDPSQSSEKMDETVQKQLDALVCLLEDPQPMVRSTATLGVCKILAKCWEVIPPTVITDFLKKLVVELASDCSSPDVRCSVFKCLPIVLDNSLSHPLLEQLLPVLKYGLHDSSEKVRVAFLDMLLKIKAVRAAKFWKVCSMEHLLARLAVDSQPISKRIVDLLFNSFFPVNQSEEVWCERCVTLIQMNPKAARKFYQYAHLYTAPTNIAKLMLTIRRCLNACIQNTGELNESRSSNKENASVLEDVLSVSDTASMASLLEVVVILWRSIRKALEHNKDALQYTVSKFGAVIPKYFNIFQEERCTVPLILLASLLPPASVPTFSVGVLSRLRNMEPGVQQSQYSQVIDCLCSWGQASDSLELITHWLTEALPRTASKGNASRKVRITEPVEAKPDLGLDYLEYLVGRAATRDSILPLVQGPLKQLHKALGAWRSVLYSHLCSPESEASVPSAETALRAFTLHGRLSVHLQHAVSEGRDHLASLENMAAWVAERVLPFLVRPGEAGSAEGQLELARRVVESFLTVCRDMIRVGLGDEEFKGHLLHLCSLVLLSEKGYRCVPLLVSVLTEVAENYVPQDAPGQEEQEVGQHDGQSPVILGVVANVFQKVLEVLARRMRKEPEEGQELCLAALPSLGAFLQVVTAWGVGTSNPLSGVFSTISAAVIVESRHMLQKISHAQEVTRPESVDDLPPLSSTLLTVILKSPPVTRAFLSEVKSSVESEAIDCLTGLAAVLNILAVIRQEGKARGETKATAVSVQLQLQKHSSVTAEEEGHAQRVIYESAIKSVNEFLMV
ncbi:condensin-2 complex subunit G2 [Hypomesus transpacificus]|uniref:condensin-2 complex subunit G2 n=1 Tax=Hypomesus transpacificus TaxID=137520 RepID=UPI001F07439A|nr:condensin-2 complex subunit G2 [Hypomesus transpacificus]XP_046880192.1 condensin-2 complex subunit G2 [Hypomesus transpacificus]XP_046880193.1 condensin-2 complex subunit G2 [Hypomesus transpacificus]